MNALMIGMNNIGVLAKNGHLSMDLVDDFCGVYFRMFATRWRRVIQIFMMVNISKHDEPTMPGQDCSGCSIGTTPSKIQRAEREHPNKYEIT